MNLSNRTMKPEPIVRNSILLGNIIFSRRYSHPVFEISRPYYPLSREVRDFINKRIDAIKRGEP